MSLYKDHQIYNIFHNLCPDILQIDDFWCSNIINGTGNCNDPVQGPTEIDRNSAADMGLSDNDIRDITQGWLDTMTAVQSYMLQRGAYTWSLIPGVYRISLLQGNFLCVE